MRYLFLPLIIFAVLFEVWADILFKKWSLGSRNVWLAAGLILYFVGTLIWAYSLKFGFLSRAVTIFTILNFVLVLLAGIILFKENLSLINIIGICLGLVGIVMIQI